MKKNKLLLLISISTSLLLIFCILCYRIQNDKNIYFSKDSGFYDEEFYLEIKANKKYNIRYTLDGTTPNINSIKYTKPILIDDTSTNNNHLSNIVAKINLSKLENDLSEIRKNIDINKITINDKILYYEKANFLVPKHSVVKVAIFNNRNEIINSVTKCYFIDYKNKKEFNNLNIISIIIEQSDFINDKEPAIYSNIKYILSGNKKDIDIAEIIPDLQKNAEIFFFSGNRKFLLKDNITIKLSGTFSKSTPHKSFKILSKNNFVAHHFFKVKKNSEYIIFATSTDKLHIKDYLINKLEKNKKKVKLIPCALFINGEFWGAYFLKEAHGTNYIRNHYNIKTRHFYYHKNDNIKRTIDDILFNKEILYNENINENIDNDSLIEYFALNLYINNVDILFFRNTFFYKEIQDGSKWVINGYDYNTDSVFGKPIPEMNIVDYYINNSKLFKKIMENENLYNALKERIEFLQNNVYKQDNIDIILNNYKKNFMPIVNLNNKKYYGNNLEITENDINEIKIFFQNRSDYLIKELDKYYNENKNRK